MLTFVGNVANQNYLTLATPKILNTWYPNPELAPGQIMYSVNFNEGADYGSNDDIYTVLIPTDSGARTISMTKQELESLIGGVFYANTTTATLDLVLTSTPVESIKSTTMPATPVTNIIPTSISAPQIDAIKPERLSEDEKNFGMILGVLGLLAIFKLNTFFKRLNKMSKKTYPSRLKNNGRLDLGRIETVPTEDEVFDMCRNERMIEDEVKAVIMLKAKIGQLEDVLEGRVKPKLDNLDSSALRKLYEKIDKERTGRIIHESVSRGEHWGGGIYNPRKPQNDFEPPSYLRPDGQGNSTTNIRLSSDQIESNFNNNHWNSNNTKGPLESSEDDISLPDEVIRKARKIENLFKKGKKNDK